MKSRLLVCIVALLALVAASCGSDDVEAVVTDTELESDVSDAADDAEATDEDAMADDAPDDAVDEAMADVDDADIEDEAMADESVEDEAMADESVEDEAMADADIEDEAMADTPQRIVSLSPTSTEMLFAIGAGDQVIAVDSFSNFPATAPITELSAYEPNIEAIAGFEPDLVISSAPLEGLDAIGIDNYVAPAANNLDEIYAQIEQLGALTGHIGEAAEVVQQMQIDIDAVLASLPERETPLTFYHELDNTLYSVTSGTFIGYVYDLFGLVNVADPADPDGESFGYPQLNEEFLVTANPDLIFLADTLCCEQNAETVAARPGWDQISAVQNGNVVELNDDVVSRWGPRIVEFIETVGIAVNELEPVAAN